MAGHLAPSRGMDPDCIGGPAAYQSEPRHEVFMPNPSTEIDQPSEKTLHMIPGTPIPAGPKPWGILVDEDNSTAYVCDSGGSNVLPISTKALTPGNPIQLAHSPDLAVLNRRTHTLYALSIDGYVMPIDTRTNDAGTPISVEGGFPRADTESIVLDQKNDILYVADFFGGRIYIIDPKTGKQMPGSPIVLNVRPQDIEIDEANDTLYVLYTVDNPSNPGYVLPISTRSLDPAVDPIAVGYAPFVMVLDKVSRYLYIANDDRRITTVFTPTNTVDIGAIDHAGLNMAAMAVDEGYQILYVVGSDDSAERRGRVVIFRADVGKVDGSVSVGDLPNGIAVDQDMHTVYVTSITDGTVIPLQPRIDEVHIDVPKPNGSVPAGEVRFSGTGQPGAMVRLQVVPEDRPRHLVFPPTGCDEKGRWVLTGSLLSSGTYAAVARQFMGSVETSRSIVRFNVS
jgi:DNA-binding beta-propeller fold protein YncE